MVEEENFLGELPVSARLALGSERLRLLFTQRRIIVDHVGKRGSGAMAGFSIFGALSSALEDIFKTGKETAGRRGVQKMSPTELLKTHRDNFMIAYNEIVGVTLTRTPQLSTNITILTSEDKFEFSSRKQYDTILSLFKDRLANKVTIRPH